ncbi:MAPK kinase substrate protein At1g80180-like [Vicia villosa]|uniref:MAPK kinase substrate protein At1g80180-like n=1 Tax=Vicia villosa TaxID=3911 RepID=UPI00273B6053|nr:MAPK kinase substrate protein At1g80180-like [Vicia villosa]
MASLPRSQVSFRRSGSSGLVWDDTFLSGELNKLNTEQQQYKNTTTIEDDNNNNNLKEHHTGYRTVKVSPSTNDPPSPKISACGFCNPFAKKSQPMKPGTRRSR